MPVYTNVRIASDTNKRMKSVLAKSRLSRDQFVDYLLTEAMDQIEGLQPAAVLPHINVVRRENNLPPIEIAAGSIAERLLRLESKDAPNLRVAEDSPDKKKRGSNG